MKMLFCLGVSLLITSITSLSLAQVPASQGSIVIPAGAGNLETTINQDTLAGGARIHPRRIYLLQKNQTYVQHAAIRVVNPTGIITIIGEPGGKKPVIIMTPVNAIPIQQNEILGSLKLVNIHYQAQQTDGTLNNENWVMTTSSNLPQSLTIDNCLFEFCNIDLFECNGWTKGAKFKITNSYFRNLFHKDQWWGSRVFMCKNPIDTLWVENTTTTGGGLIFLNQNALTKFAYFNHNTIVNNKKYWLKAPYFVELYVCNNIFINQNWSGEDWENTIKHGEDPDTLITSTIDIDSVNSPGSTVKVQQEYYAPGSSMYTDALNADKMKVFISNNIHYSDTLLNRYYTTDAYNTLGRNYPLSYLAYPIWFGRNPPYQVVNIPCAWMNARTKAMIAKYQHNMVEKYTIADDPHTVTPGIKDATVADQMAKWNQCMWYDPAYPSSANDILNSAYIFGDYDPTTIPGYKTESGSGIAKFTDLTENFAQTGIIHISSIDALPIGSLIWDDALNGLYNSGIEYTAVMGAYIFHTVVGVADVTSLPLSFELSQNYPNPFNPTTKINFTLAKTSNVRLTVYNVLGQKVMTLVDSRISAGPQSVVFDASKLTSGVYFYCLDTGSFSSVKKMLLLK
jgi:hypothetical protein